MSIFPAVARNRALQIIEFSDQDFPDLYSLLQTSDKVGEVIELGGTTLVVCATQQFLMVAPKHKPTFIAIHPAHTKFESVELARKYLEDEAEWGNQVSLFPEQNE